MTVQELIDRLQEIKDKTTRVVVSGYEGGYSDADDTYETMLELNVHSEWYYGKHEEAKDGLGVPAIVIR